MLSAVCVWGMSADAYMGSEAMNDKEYPAIKAKAEAVCAEKQRFERIVLTKDEVRTVLPNAL